MMTFEVTYDMVKGSYPDEVNSFLQTLRNSNSKQKDIDISDIKWYYSFGFFSTKSLYNDPKYENYHNMLYSDRVKFEMSKVRVEIVMKAKTFVLCDRFQNKSNSVSTIAEETVKFMMLSEQKYIMNRDVFNSIPDPGIKFEDLEEYDDNENIDFVDFEQDIELDLDTILDKINISGMESLTKEEMSFLKKMGK